MSFKVDNAEEIGKRPDIMVNCLKLDELPSSKRQFGQLYVNKISPGKVRGNHYHRKKHEWLFCVKGRVLVAVKGISSSKISEVILSEHDLPLKKLYIPPDYAHSVKNIGNDEAIIVEYSSEQHNPKEDDYLRYEIIK